MTPLVAVLFLLVLNPVIADDQPRVAIAPFRFTGANAQIREFADSLPEMLSTNLGRSFSISVLERPRLVEVLRELRLQQTDYIDGSTAQAIGRVVGANRLLVGSVTSLGTLVRLDSRLVDVATGKVVASAKAEGGTDNLFALADALSSRLLTASGAEPQFIQERRLFSLDQVFTISATPNPPGRETYIPLYSSSNPPFEIEGVIRSFNPTDMFSQAAPRVPEDAHVDLKVGNISVASLWITDRTVTGSVTESTVTIGDGIYSLRLEVIDVRWTPIYVRFTPGRYPRGQLAGATIRIVLTPLQ